MNPSAVTLRSQHPQITVTCLLGDGPLAPVFNNVGWAEVQRPKRVAITDWQGYSPLRIALPLMFDGFRDDDSVERDLSRIEDMASPVDSRHHPPILRVAGAGIPQRYKQRDWVIETIEYGTGILDVSRNVRTRQQVTLSLLQHIGIKAVDERNVSPGHKTGKGHRIYVVKRGDTLQKIAAHLLGDYKRWKDIAKLNNIRDPKHLKIGRHIKVPRN